MGQEWLTTLSSIRRGEPDWRAIAAYEGPVRRYLARRYGMLGEAERDDLLQELLIAMRERIVPRYDAGRGPFRSFLAIAVENKAKDRLRRKRGEARPSLEQVAEPAAPPADDELDALDLEAAIVGAIQAVHDRHASGPEQDLTLVYVLAGVLVHGRSNKEIAAAEQLSVDQVKRLLQKARDAVLRQVLAGLLPAASPEALIARAADLARACLREPRRESRLLDAEPEGTVRAAVEGFTRRMREAERHLSGGASGQDLLRGIAAVFSA